MGANLIQASYSAAVSTALSLLECNVLPDFLVRKMTRLLLAARLRSGYRPSSELQLSDLLRFKESLKVMPIAVETDKAKSQHYEVPTQFFKLVLGKNLKYSCCYFLNNSSTLEDAETAMLEIYCERAQIKDGQTILDIGCGWGSFSLYVAKKYSNCRIKGICNSTTQRAYIEDQCKGHKISNLEIIVADISKCDMNETFDRILSIEMFEHMKNYKELLKKISNWMNKDSLLFIHYFCHKSFAYHFEDTNADDWITRYFFTGGTMPSANLLLYFQFSVRLTPSTTMPGGRIAREPTTMASHLQHGAFPGIRTHDLFEEISSSYQLSYRREEWLKRMDKNTPSILPIMESTYGKDAATKWTAYWRTFFIAVAELFRYNNGEEWMVAHFLFKKK